MMPLPTASNYMIMLSPHLSRLLGQLFPISIGLHIFTDGGVPYNSIDLWVGDEAKKVSTQSIIDVEYLEQLLDGKSPDSVYEKLIPFRGSVSAVPAGSDGYRFRFQTADASVLESFLAALASA